MSTFILRNIDPELWRKVRSRAALDGITAREALMRLLRAYAAGLPSYEIEGRQETGTTHTTD